MNTNQLRAALSALYDNTEVSFGDVVSALSEVAHERCLFQTAQELREIADRIEAGHPDHFTTRILN